MRAKRLLCMLALPALLGLGCYAGPTAQVGVAYGEPPPPPAYYYVPGAIDGYVWIDGNWYWNYGQWAWRPGYYIAARPGYAWTQGRWYGHNWRPGSWQPSRTPTYVRDHRGFAAPAPTGRVVVPSRAAAPPPAKAAPRAHR